MQGALAPCWVSGKARVAGGETNVNQHTLFLVFFLQGVLEGFDFRGGEDSGFAWGQVAEVEGALGDSFEFEDSEVQVPHHAADLAVEALHECQVHAGLVVGGLFDVYADRGEAFAFVQSHAVGHGADHVFCDFAAYGYLVDFG